MKHFEKEIQQAGGEGMFLRVEQLSFENREMGNRINALQTEI